jgi:hypothetical protein
MSLRELRMRVLRDGKTRPGAARIADLNIVWELYLKTVMRKREV